MNQPPTVDAGQDTSLIIPDSVQLSASITDDDFPGFPTSVFWSQISGPSLATVSTPSLADTQVTFSEAGNYAFEVTVQDGEFTTSDTVTVEVFGEAVLTSITVSPSFVNLTPNSSQTFTAVGVDQIGGTFSITPSWSSNGGVIDQSGQFVAGNTLGDFSVNAAFEGITGEANIVISDPNQNWPTNGWDTTTPVEADMNIELLEQAVDFAGGAGMITRGGKLVMSWGDTDQRYAVRSATKSIGSAALGLAIKDNLLSLNDTATLHLPEFGIPPEENNNTGWLENTTILHLATQTAGFDKSGGYISQLYEPGTAWAYTDGGQNWLADVITTLFMEDLHSVLFNRVFYPLGITESDLTWRTHTTRDQDINGITRREFSSGINATADALARIGYLYLRNGRWENQSILPADFVSQVGMVPQSIQALPVLNDTQSRFGNASNHYGIMWWNNADGSITDVPTDTYWAWGLGESLIVVIPSLDIVISRTGSNAFPGSRSPSYYQVLEPFIRPIAQSTAVPNLNQAPSVNAGADQTITLPTSNVTLAGTVSDDDFPGNPLTLAWSLVSGPTSVSFSNPNNASTSVTLSAEGVYTLQLLANDGEFIDTDTITVTVLPPPDTTAPTLSIISPSNGDTISGGISVEVIASDNVAVTSLELRIDGILQPAPMSSPNSFSWDSTSVSDGDHTLSVTAFDAAGNNTTQSLNITVNNNIPPSNQPPSVNVGSDQTITLPNSILLSPSVSDDGLPSSQISLSWLLISGPDSVEFSSPNTAETSVLFHSPGQYVLSLVADDSELSSSDSLTVTVLAEPVLSQISISPSSISLMADQTQIFNASGIDQYGNPFDILPTWSATGGTIIDGVYTAGSETGSYSVTASVDGFSAQATVNIVSTQPKQTFLSFDGSNDYVEIPDTDALDLSSGEFTLALWIRPTGWGNNSQGRLMDHGGGSTSAGWTLQLENKASKGYPQALRLQNNNDSSFDGMSNNNSIVLDQWQHVAVTLSSGTLTFYIDGIEQGVRTGVPAPLPTDLPIRLGIRASDLKRAFEGDMDDVQVWNRALTQTEILQQMDSELSGNETGLIAYYKFNEGQGETLLDASVNANNAIRGSTDGADSNNPSWITQ